MKLKLMTMMATFLAIADLSEVHAQSGMAFPCGWSSDSTAYYGKPVLYSLAYNPITEFFTVSAVFDTTVAPTSDNFFLGPGAQLSVLTPDGFGPNTGTTADAGGINNIMTEPYSSANQQTIDDNLFANVPSVGPYPASCFGKEYHIFGVSANFAQNGITSGVPVSLFSFKGNSCAGTVALMDQYDPGASDLLGILGINFRHSAQVVMAPSGVPISVDRYCGNLQPAGGITRQIPDGINETYTATSGFNVTGNVIVNEYAIVPVPPLYNVPESTLAVTRIASSDTVYDSMLNLNNDGTFVFNTPLLPLAGTYNFTYQYTTVCNQFKTAQATITWGSPLPIALISFTAKAMGSNIVLNWQTSSQGNNTYFDVEHSKNGSLWYVLGAVNGAEQQKSYTFQHNTPQGKKNYYRLKHTDKDLKSTYSNVLVVDMDNSRPIKISPNPATDILHIRLQGNKVTHAEVYDITGKLIRTAKLDSKDYKLFVADLNPGLYILKLRYTDQSIQVLKWIKG